MALSEPVIRPFRADDLSFVYDSWLNSWRSSPYAGVIPNNQYYDVTRSVIDELIARGATILVMDSGKSLLGWVCGEEKAGRSILHYFYLKDAFRGRGLGLETKLLEALPGKKPGFMTFYRVNLEKAGWVHCPEIARRQTL